MVTWGSLMRNREVEETSLVSLTTCVIWCGFLAAGVIGLLTPYSYLLPPAKEPVVQAEVLNVELSDDLLPEPETAASAPALPRIAQPPTPAAVKMPQQAPPMILVAQPMPMIEFALPVESPVRVVEAKQASYSPPPKKVAASTTGSNAKSGDKVISAGTGSGGTRQTLTFGRGEGKQPKPGYPRRAVLEGQQGVVVIRFSVGENGRVAAAEAIQPSRWPLLNEEALRTVRERWRFRPGAVRSYEVAIRFVLED